MQKQALGKGLGALIPDLTALDEKERKALGIHEVELDKIVPNEYQPRKVFDDGRLKELASSIREQGVIQPVLVHRIGSNYGLIAGERRWRAARLAGLKTIPAIVKEATKRELIEQALIENIQREDLNPLEAAGRSSGCRTSSSSPRRTSRNGWARSAPRSRISSGSSPFPGK
jgi:ParB family chromosome partitioning protein